MVIQGRAKRGSPREQGPREPRWYSTVGLEHGCSAVWDVGTLTPFPVEGEKKYTSSHELTTEELSKARVLQVTREARDKESGLKPEACSSRSHARAAFRGSSQERETRQGFFLADPEVKLLLKSGVICVEWHSKKTVCHAIWDVSTDSPLSPAPAGQPFPGS